MFQMVPQVTHGAQELEWRRACVNPKLQIQYQRSYEGSMVHVGKTIAVAGVITTAVGAAVFDEPDLDPVPATSPPLPPSAAALMNPPAAVTRQLRRRMSAYGVDVGGGRGDEDGLT